jgi:Domain of unknown function (DUF4124)
MHSQAMPLPLIFALLLALVPAAASARIYKWVDENGTTVYSNVPPADGDALKKAKVVIEDEESFRPTAAQAQVLSRQQEILERLYALERQVSARQYGSPPPPPPPPDYYEGYYPPSYYAAPYYPLVPSYVISRPFFVAPAHRFIAHRPGFVSIHRAPTRRFVR